jgi:hypothetical protein
MYLDECSHFSESWYRRLVPVAVEHRVGVDLFGSVFTDGAVRVEKRGSRRPRAVEPASIATAGGKRLVRKLRFGDSRVNDNSHDTPDTPASGAEQRHYRFNDNGIDGDIVNRGGGNGDRYCGFGTSVRVARDELEFRRAEFFGMTTILQ